jgi:hypothetical protein
VAVRLYRASLDPMWLLVGIAAMACLGSGLCMTTFMRRAEYGAPPPTEDGQPAQLARGGVVRLVEQAARIVVHYPSYIWLCAAIPPGRLDVFFWAYAGVNVLYAGRSFLQIFLKLGRFA